ncbi:MAG: 50S ribosomal protein L21 [Parcubacteria group bacterium]
MLFAIIKTGGKQYKVSEGTQLNVEKLDVEEGKEFDFDQILLIGNAKAEATKIGSPLVEGAIVHAKVLEQGRDKKKLVFKYSNKTRYRKKKGHRQPYTKIEILKITA